VKVNITALLTLEQVRAVTPCVADGPPCYISVFAGRIADAGCDPVPVMRAALEHTRSHRNIELIWASPRELLNIVQADQIGCHVITVTHDLLRKLQTLGRDLHEFSLDTVRMFYRDAIAAGYKLSPETRMGEDNVVSSSATTVAR
jgi:transaldolase